APDIFWPDTAGFAACGSGGGLVFDADVQAPSATINLMSLTAAQKNNADKKTILDIAQTAHVVQLAVTGLELSFDTAPHLSTRSHEMRCICLGMTGLAPLLMQQALAYDSDEGRATASLVTALLSALCYQTSATLADTLGACDAYADTSKDFLQGLKDKMAVL